MEESIGSDMRGLTVARFIYNTIKWWRVPEGDADLLNRLRYGRMETSIASRSPNDSVLRPPFTIPSIPLMVKCVQHAFLLVFTSEHQLRENGRVLSRIIRILDSHKNEICPKRCMGRFTSLSVFHYWERIWISQWLSYDRNDQHSNDSKPLCPLRCPHYPPHASMDCTFLAGKHTKIHWDTHDRVFQWLPNPSFWIMPISEIMQLPNPCRVLYALDVTGQKSLPLGTMGQTNLGF